MALFYVHSNYFNMLECLFNKALHFLFHNVSIGGKLSLSSDTYCPFVAK